MFLIPDPLENFTWASNVHLLQHEETAIRQQACDENAKWISAVAILDEGVYLGFENNFNLFIDR
ncbi:hypothetical protein CUMW_209000 [Citrus unshiu]|uniref:Uncharacterized protein n=1 Tax=Citrus unshiu TaxID=55188 RepID=A0A2H5Q9J9_CITUN|nr:hypothetical protein CUMW_209000 [Citrus unshiu]